MIALIESVDSTLSNPEIVRRSVSDTAVEMFYCFYARTVVGGKWLCVVVKYRV